MQIRDVALRTCWKQWTKGRGGERGSGISVLMMMMIFFQEDILSLTDTITQSVELGVMATNRGNE